MPKPGSHIPEMHRQLLEDKVAIVRLDADVSSVLHQYRAIRPSLKKTGLRLIDTLYRQIDGLYGLLVGQDAVTERQKKVAVAALMYFLSNDDKVSDEHYSVTGLVDDALVVEAAIEELGELVKY